MYFSYILQSSLDGSYYFGFTTDVTKRLDEHNRGCSFHTRKHMPWNLIWYGAFADRSKAAKFEQYLKTGSGYAFSRKRLI